MTDDQSPATPIDRRAAQGSDTVSYADPVVLHETTRTRVTFVPFFIKHTDHTELAIKIQTFNKEAKASWVLKDEKSISMKEPAARKLLEALKQHLAVSGQQADGNYVVIPVRKGVAEVAGIDPGTVASAVAGLLTDKEVVKHIGEQELTGKLVDAFRGAIRLQELRTALATLRLHLDRKEVDESIYQKWCERHTWAFGNAYVLRDDVRTVSTGDKLDLLLPSVLAGYRDLVELKRPDMEVLNYDQTHKNFYWSADAAKAIGQCHRYLDVLAEEAAKGLRDHPEIVAYHPRAIVVMGRSSTWVPDKVKALHGLNSRLNAVTVMTYDNLLSLGERLLSVVAAPGDGVDADEERATPLEDEPF